MELFQHIATTRKRDPAVLAGTAQSHRLLITARTMMVVPHPARNGGLAASCCQ